MTLDTAQLTAFVTVVRAGSFTAAADVLETDKAHLSRLVSRLEEYLGAQLLTRSTRALTLTEIGRDVYERSTGILAAMEDVVAVTAHAQSAPSGVLRLTCGEEFGALVVSQWIVAFQKTYPDVRVEVTMTNRVVDLFHEGFDLAIRVGALPDSALSARKLGEISYGVYASPAYLKRRRKPERIADLAGHDYLSFSGGAATPTLHNGEEKFTPTWPPRLIADNNALLRTAAAGGLGVAVLPSFQGDALVRRGMLATILLGWGRPAAPVHAVFASSRFLAPKVRAFVDLAKEEFAASLAAVLI